MNYSIIDDPDYEPIEGWEKVPFLKGYVHFDPSKIDETEIYKMIDDYLNCRNEDIYDNLAS